MFIIFNRRNIRFNNKDEIIVNISHIATIQINYTERKIIFKMCGGGEHEIDYFNNTVTINPSFDDVIKIIGEQNIVNRIPKDE